MLAFFSNNFSRFSRNDDTDFILHHLISIDTLKPRNCSMVLDISFALFFCELCSMPHGNSWFCLSVPKMMIKLAQFLHYISSMTRVSIFFYHCQTLTVNSQFIRTCCICMNFKLWVSDSLCRTQLVSSCLHRFPVTVDVLHLFAETATESDLVLEHEWHML